MNDKRSTSEAILLSASLSNLYLTQKDTMRNVSKHLLGLQAQFNANPYYSLMIRSNNYDETEIIQNYVKTWSFRGTIHLVHKSDLYLHLSSRNHHQWTDHWGMDASDKPYWSAYIIEAIKSGFTTRAELKKACLEAKMSDAHFDSVFHGWGGLLQEMCLRGLIAYKPTNAKEFMILDSVEFIDQQKARLKVIEQYFKQYGPATIQDCAYFTGFKVKEVKTLIEEISLFEIDLDDKKYYSTKVLSDDIVIPEIIILAGFDPLILGYKDKGRFMNESELRKYVTNTGIIFPGILIDGKLACRWQKKGHTITVKPYRKILVKHQKMIKRHLSELFIKHKIVIESEII